MTAEKRYRRLLVAPEGIRNGIIDAINHEMANKEAGRPARVRIKVNSIVDERIIDALYRASRAGVPVDLWVRGICAIKPGIPGLSENIRVRSILGRFLEHSRIFWFENGGSPIVAIGSADLMHRNLDRRVESLVGLSNRTHVAEIDDLFNLAFDENTVSWQLTGDTWTQVSRDSEGNPLTDLQEELIRRTRMRRK